MRSPRAEAWYTAIFVALAAAATAAVLAGGGSAKVAISAPPMPSLQSHPAVTIGERVIVVLRTPSLGEHVAALGGAVDVESEQAWSQVVLSAQRLLLARLALHGVLIHPDLHFTRVLDGFSAVIPPSVITVVERDSDVAGVYPVRAAYPVAVSTQAAETDSVGGALAAAGIDGRGVTIALLDTGVGRAIPLLVGRLLPQIDIAPAGGEAHGTETAEALARAAPGASVLPIRVADAYARSDQLIAGLDRAVDPNGDGDAHDAARIALVPLAEPFAGFPDGPESRAIAGARALDLLVVAPAGTDGGTAAAYGDLAAPGASPDAVTVGALDARPQVEAAHVVVRSGLHTLFDATAPFADAAPRRPVDLRVVAARSFITSRGASNVAGRAVLLAPGQSARRAAVAGAAAVLLDGGIRSESVDVPVLALPHSVARAIRKGPKDVTIAIGVGHPITNPAQDRVPAFSSTGLAYDGSVKPDIVASSAAAVAGAAAALAQARPSLGADALRGLLVGTARPVPGPVTAQGAGALDLGAAVSGEVAASPTTLALGVSTAPGRKVEAAFTLTNVSSRVLRIALGIRTQHEGAATVDFTLRPSEVSLAPGASALVHVDALTASRAIGSGTADGAVVGSIDGGGSVRIPWAIAFAEPADVLGAVTVANRLLTVQAGRVTTVAGAVAIRPLARLDVLLRTVDGRPLGLLARLRDVLPGRYVFQLTGRGPNGKSLAPGKYVATVVAYPADGGPPSRKAVIYSDPR